MNAPDPVRHLEPTASASDLFGLDMIRRLVAFPTVSRDSNLELIESLHRELTRMGVTKAMRFEPGAKA